MKQQKTKTKSKSKTAFAPRANSLPYAGLKIGISLPIVYKLVREGKLRTYKIGRAHRVSDEAIADCIKQLEDDARRAA